MKDGHHCLTKHKQRAKEITIKIKAKKLNKFNEKKDFKMKNNFDTIQEEVNVTDRDIFTKIWFSPRRIFKFINDQQYDKYLTVLLALSGIRSALSNQYLLKTGDGLSTWVIIMMCIILGGIFGWVSYYIMAALLSWTGKLFKGEGDTKSILRITAYGMIPSILSLVFLIPLIAIYGDGYFKSGTNRILGDWFLNSIVVFSLISQFILTVWTTVFTVIGLSEVQKISIAKSILNIILPILILLIPLGAISFILGDFFK